MNVAETCIYLLSCALNQQKPSVEFLPDMSDLWRFSVRHGIAATVASLLLETDLITEPKWKAIWQERLYKYIRKNVNYELSRAEIEQRLIEAKIWFAPLKGIVINKLYPENVIREFSDNDILVENGRQEEIIGIMTSLGYSHEDFSEEVHLTFHKDNILNFEMHHKLFRDVERFRAFNIYYENIEAKLLTSAQSVYSRCFTDEDAYLFFLAHCYKHFAGSGIGLRFFADIYVYNQKKRMDKAYLRTELEKLGLRDFAATAEEIAAAFFNPQKPFSEAVLSQRQKEMYDLVTDNGGFDNSEKRYALQFSDFIEETGESRKLLYIKSRLFPDMEAYKRSNPFFYRHKALRPLFYLYRPVYGLVTNRKAIFGELKTVVKYKKD